MVLDGYPGVYIQEVPSGVRPIVAASTSTLAVLGHFPRGPVGTPIKVTSWNDVVRSFGALDRRYVSLYTLQDFFQQGGSFAWVSRIAFDRPALTLSSVERAMVVEAREAGAGGNTITIAIERNGDGSFDLIVSAGGGTSTFPSLSEDPASPRFVERIVNAPPDEGGSPLVRVRDTRFAPAELAAVALAGGPQRQQLCSEARTRRRAHLLLAEAAEGARLGTGGAHRAGRGPGGGLERSELDGAALAEPTSPITSGAEQELNTASRAVDDPKCLRRHQLRNRRLLDMELRPC